MVDISWFPLSRKTTTFLSAVGFTVSPTICSPLAKRFETAAPGREEKERRILLSLRSWCCLLGVVALFGRFAANCVVDDGFRVDYVAVFNSTSFFGRRWGPVAIFWRFGLETLLVWNVGRCPCYIVAGQSRRGGRWNSSPPRLHRMRGCFLEEGWLGNVWIYCLHLVWTTMRAKPSGIFFGAGWMLSGSVIRWAKPAVFTQGAFPQWALESMKIWLHLILFDVVFYHYSR